MVDDIDLSSILILIVVHRFERKFADIGHTVRQQYEGGLYSICSWADMVNVHVLPGPSIVEAIKQVDPSKGCVVIAQMSNEGNLLSDSYTKEAIKIATGYKDFIVGFICTSRVSDDAGFIHLTPGVSMEAAGDKLGQQYLTPQEVIFRRQSDVIIVGRGILQAPDPVHAAMMYRKAGYDAYLACLS